MKKKLILSFIVLGTLLSSCSSDDSGTAVPFEPETGSGGLPGDCNVQVVTINRITEDEVTDDAAIGDYFITLKSVNTVKDKISVEVQYFIGNTPEATVNVSSSGSVGIDETIEFKISSADINTVEDWVCIQYFITAEAEGSPDCTWDGNDC